MFTKNMHRGSICEPADSYVHKKKRTVVFKVKEQSFVAGKS